MTVAANASKVQYNCDGITKAFAFTFNCAATSEVQVILTDANGVETVLVETLNYTVSATGRDYTAGGTVTTVATYATGNKITILRNMAITQEADFYEGQPTLYGTFEQSLDHLARIIQQLYEKTTRSPLLPRSATISNPVLPNPEGSKYLGWNPSATNLENKSAPVQTTVGATSVKYLSNYADFATAISAIGSTATTLVIDTTANVAVDTTTPATLHLRVERNGAFAVSAGVTLTVGSLEAGLYQIFSGAGTVALGTGSVIAAYPEWWGADNTGVASSSAACNAWAASGCKRLRLVPGGTYLLKEVTLPGESYFELDGSHATIVPEGTNGDAATCCFQVTFNADTNSSAFWVHFWTFKNLVINASGSYGYAVDFLKINTTNYATVTDITVKNIKGKGGLQADPSTPMNSIVKFTKSGPTPILPGNTPENVNVSNIQANGGILVYKVFDLSADLTSNMLAGHFWQIFHAVPSDGNAQTICSNCAFTRSGFDMIYNAGGTVLELYNCMNSKFDRIYQEALVNDATVIKGMFQNCDFSKVVTIGHPGTASGERLFDGKLYSCNMENLAHNRSTGLGSDKTIVIQSNSRDNWIKDLWSPYDSNNRYYFQAIDDSGTNTVLGPPGYVTSYWLPTLAGAGTAGTITPYEAYSTLHYQRTNNTVHISGALKIETVADSPTGYLKISLPYTVANATRYSAVIAVSALGMDAGAATAIDAYAEKGEKFFYVHAFSAGAAVAQFAELINVDTVFRISGTYVAKSDFT